MLAGRVLAEGELLDLDRPDRLERNLLEVLVGDHDVLVGRVLVALDRVAARDDRLVRGAPDLHLDPRPVRGVEHVEADRVLGLGRRVELDRDRDQAELDRALPYRACHALLRRTRPPATPGAASVDRERDSTT